MFICNFVGCDWNLTFAETFSLCLTPSSRYYPLWISDPILVKFLRWNDFLFLTKSLPI
ncbi:hypothetical protein OIU77_017919 [Salix suchowensis]|uniref:Uncharacterized protein n=1 Tax=Salix suchowensis TaxID=1278906 RepID=A0ABQ8ZQZ7_9ROSI|nr:hypothetical protein OIU77_017919 [Salix suchowensis]